MAAIGIEVKILLNLREANSKEISPSSSLEEFAAWFIKQFNSIKTGNFAMRMDIDKKSDTGKPYEISKEGDAQWSMVEDFSIDSNNAEGQCKSLKCL